MQQRKSTSDTQIEAAFQVIAEIPTTGRNAENCRRIEEAARVLRSIKPARSSRRRVTRDPDLSRRYYRAMRRFGLWSAPGCDPSPLHETTFQRLTANDEEPRHA